MRAMIHGYARVSTDGQSVDAQVKQVRATGLEDVFQKTASGARSHRRALGRALRELVAGDVLIATRLGRLARSTRALLNILTQITESEAGFNSLADAWADTTTSHERLMLTVLGGLEKFQSEVIRVRTGEGRARANARGVKLVRRPKLTNHQQTEAMIRHEAGELMRDIARTFKVSNSTISRLPAHV